MGPAPDSTVRGESSENYVKIQPKTQSIQVTGPFREPSAEGRAQAAGQRTIHPMPGFSPPPPFIFV
jgi:hypothetical protein